MSKVITFSRHFPAYHPRAGEPTYFVEKIWQSIYMDEKFRGEDQFYNLCDLGFDLMPHDKYQPKHHTIRAGHRFKVGDWFSPRVWSGKPYNSKQIIIAPDIQVKKAWDFKIKKFENRWYIDFGSHSIAYGYEGYSSIDKLARNDGLTRQDFFDWFKYPSPFDGQIICWHSKIEY